MSDLEPKIRAYYNLQPTDYPVSQSIVLSQGIGPNGVCEQTLSMVLQKELASTAPSLRLEFYGVRKLVLQQPEWSLISIGHIEIAIPTGLRNVESNILVRDPEQEQIIRFECRDFEAYLG